jgi:hypothetical protein
MTTRDRAFEINFDHTYRIYENLTAVLELGYINLRSSNDVWSKPFIGDAKPDTKRNDSAWKAALGFRYQF